MLKNIIFDDDLTTKPLAFQISVATLVAETR